VRVRIPAGTSSGRKIRIRGRGFPAKTGDSGDLYAEVRIVVPDSLSPEEKELYESIREKSTFRPRTDRREKG
jgi:curved DNA-binding protein